MAASLKHILQVKRRVLSPEPSSRLASGSQEVFEPGHARDGQPVQQHLERRQTVVDRGMLVVEDADGLAEGLRAPSVVADTDRASLSPTRSLMCERRRASKPAILATNG